MVSSSSASSPLSSISSMTSALASATSSLSGRFVVTELTKGCWRGQHAGEMSSVSSGGGGIGCASDENVSNGGHQLAPGGSETGRARATFTADEIRPAACQHPIVYHSTEVQAPRLNVTIPQHHTLITAQLFRPTLPPPAEKCAFRSKSAETRFNHERGRDKKSDMPCIIHTLRH